MTILTFLPILGIIGPQQLILIIVLIIIFFGAKKIPDLMRGAGRGIKEFKDAMNKDYSNENNNTGNNSNNASNSSSNPEIDNK